MTIEKGKDWGSRAPLPPNTPIADDDAALASLFTSLDDGRLQGPTFVGLTAGNASSRSCDLARTVSARGSTNDLRSGERPHLPMDLAVVTLDDARFVMAASLVIRQRGWFGVTECAMNAAFLGLWNVTPRGHPNDGRLDVVRAELSLGDRLKARSRLPSGSHLPHPDISIRRLKSHTFHPSNAASVWIDGVHRGRAREVAVTVVADATTVVI